VVGAIGVLLFLYYYKIDDHSRIWSRIDMFSADHYISNCAVENVASHQEVARLFKRSTVPGGMASVLLAGTLCVVVLVFSYPYLYANELVQQTMSCSTNSSQFSTSVRLQVQVFGLTSVGCHGTRISEYQQGLFVYQQNEEPHTMQFVKEYKDSMCTFTSQSTDSVMLLRTHMLEFSFVEYFFSVSYTVTVEAAEPDQVSVGSLHLYPAKDQLLTQHLNSTVSWMKAEYQSRHNDTENHRYRVLFSSRKEAVDAHLAPQNYSFPSVFPTFSLQIKPATFELVLVTAVTEIISPTAFLSSTSATVLGTISLFMFAFKKAEQSLAQWRMLQEWRRERGMRSQQEGNQMMLEELNEKLLTSTDQCALPSERLHRLEVQNNRLEAMVSHLLAQQSGATLPAIDDMKMAPSYTPPSSTAPAEYC